MAGSSILFVWWDGVLVGRLNACNGTISFSYNTSYLARLDARAVSLSLPLRDGIYKSARVHPFFAGLLPEERSRAAVARALRISYADDFRLLEALGKECAGAIQICRPDDAPEKGPGHIQWLPEDKRRSLLSESCVNSLAAIERTAGMRMSLAGAMPKVALCWNGRRFGIPRDGMPSTHIVKAVPDAFPELAENEHFCMDLARAVGLRTARMFLFSQLGRKFVVVERYDRKTRDGQTVRLHQEDFCQALGYAPQKKYQSDGGPGFAECLFLLGMNAGNPSGDIPAFLDLAVFNLCIGNADAHAKNFSILYGRDGTVSLAPAYDLVCTEIYGTFDDTPAMRWEKEGMAFARIQAKHFDELAVRAGIRPASFRQRVRKLCTKIRKQAWDVAGQNGSDIAHSIAALACWKCRTLLQRLGSD